MDGPKVTDSPSAVAPVGVGGAVDELGHVPGIGSLWSAFDLLLSMGGDDSWEGLAFKDDAMGPRSESEEEGATDSSAARSGAPALGSFTARTGSRFAATLLLLALLFGALFLIISPRVAEHFVFFPSRTDPGPPPVLEGIRGEDVTLTTSDGVRLHGWWYAAGLQAPAVLLLHGNAGNIAGRARLAEGYVERGISVLLPDYRGYGRSEGSPSEEGVQRDAEAALDFVVGRTGSAGRVVVHGRSLGGAVAARLVRDRGTDRPRNRGQEGVRDPLGGRGGDPGQERDRNGPPGGEAARPSGDEAAGPPVGGMILESAFTSLDEMAAAAYPVLPSFLFRRLRGRFDALSAVREISVPVLIVHGTGDTLVPLEMGLALHDAAAAPKYWYGVPGAGHNDVHLVGGDPYFDRLAVFVEDAVGP